jgi:hypothetical protein
VERVVFGYIFCFIAASTFFLPPHTTNPWECIFIKEPLPRRIVKFGLQVVSAAVFAAGLNRANSEFAEKLYQDVFPRVKLCNVKPFSTHHVKVFASVECTPEWPSWGDNGKFSLGIVVIEALHVFALNFAASIILPKVGRLVPLVIPCMVITAIRSPFCYLPGPALNLIPATAGAILHGGLDSWRAHTFGCGLGMTLVYLVEKRLKLLLNGEVRSIWSYRTPGSWEENEPTKRVTRSGGAGRKKADEYAAKKRANEEFDPNSSLPGDVVIKGITAHNTTVGTKSKKE